MDISKHVVQKAAADTGYHQHVARKVPFLTDLQETFMGKEIQGLWHSSMEEPDMVR